MKVLSDMQGSDSSKVNKSRGKKLFVLSAMLASFKLLAIPVVDIHNREAVRLLYNQEYLAAEGIEANWNGDVGACYAGTTSQAYQDAIVQRINYFRSMSGVKADVVLSEAFNQQAREAAVMMSANRSLSHYPPASWDCYTDAGGAAAGGSNLGLGTHGYEAITLLMEDAGGNNERVGHRRWIYYPQTQTMGSGDVVPRGSFRAAHASLVQDEHIWDQRPQTRDDFVSWPAPGFIPHNLIFKRWSLSYAGADFSNATVNMTNAAGQSIDLNVVYRSDAPQGGSISAPEQTVTWEPTGIYPQQALGGNDIDYHVVVDNVLMNGTTRSFDYTVTAIDPTVSYSDNEVLPPEEPAVVNPLLQDQPFLEMGTLTANHRWTDLSIPADISKPLVLLGPPTTNGAQPGVMQVRNELNSAVIDVRFREWYQDYIHATESVDYMMVEEGVHYFEDGTILQVSRFPIAGSKRWKSLTFDESFAGIPSVFVMLQTARGGDTASLRIKDVDTDGFKVSIFEQEKTVNSGHVQEEAAYFAFYHPQNSGIIVANGTDVAYDLDSVNANHQWTDVLGATIRVEEEASRDKETWHGFETIDTLQFGEQFFAQISSYVGPDTSALRRR